MGRTSTSLLRAGARCRSAGTAHGVGLVALLLLLSWVVSMAGGGASHVAPHAFYIPVVLAGIRFGLRGLVGGVVAATVIAGPLLPADTRLGIAQYTSDWVTRGIFFAVIGTVVTAMVERTARSIEREQRVAGMERDLGERQTTMLQAVAHEFRTPLTIIRGALEVGRQRAVDPVAFEALGRAAMGATERLSDLVDRALEAAETAPASISRGAVQGLKVIFDDLIARMGSDAARVDWRFVSSEPDLMIGADIELLRTALRCLVDNALAYSDRDTRVEVIAGPDGDRFTFSVLDRGPGIPPEVASATHPFRPSGRTRDVGGGLGLGLYTARRCTERMGGNLNVRRRAGGGTLAVISLPAERTKGGIAAGTTARIATRASQSLLLSTAAPAENAERIGASGVRC